MELRNNVLAELGNRPLSQAEQEAIAAYLSTATATATAAPAPAPAARPPRRITPIIAATAPTPVPARAVVETMAAAELVFIGIGNRARRGRWRLWPWRRWLA